jgi:hypothetical protein
MVKIEITRKGVFDQNGERIPVGTVLEFSKEPVGWKNKYRVIGEAAAEVQVATPADEELEAARSLYEEIAGKKADKRWNADRISAELEKLDDAG